MPRLARWPRTQAGWLALAGFVALGVSSAAVLGLVADGSRPTTLLRWKFRGGQSLSYRLSQRARMVLNSGDKVSESLLDQSAETTWTVQEILPDGSARIALTIDRLRSAIESPGARVVFDSRDDGEPAADGRSASVFDEAFAPVFRALIGAEITFRLGPRGAVSELTMPGPALSALKRLGPQASAAGLFSGRGLEMLLSQTIPPLPERGVERGQTWASRREIPAPPVGSTTQENTFTYRGPEDRPGGPAESIGQTTRLTFAPEAGSRVETAITRQDVRGTYLLDNAAGHLRDAKLSQSFRLVSRVGGREITQTVETTVGLRLAGPGEGGLAAPSEGPEPGTSLARRNPSSDRGRLGRPER